MQQLKYAPIINKFAGGVWRNQFWYRKCPFHSDRDPSFWIHGDTGTYRCFGCGKGGDLLDYMLNVEHFDYGEALEKLRECRNNGGIVRAPVKLKPLPADSLEMFWPVKSQHYYDYLKTRKVTKLQAKQFGLRETTGYVNVWANRVVYPVYDLKGNLWSIEGRKIEDHPIRYYKLGGSVAGRGLFGALQAAKKYRKQPLIVVEGVFDCLSVWGAGYRAVALTCSDVTEWQVSQLRKISQSVIVVFDGVRPGTEEARAEVEQRTRVFLGKFFNRFSVGTIPQANMDPNDLYRKEPQKFKKFLENCLKKFVT